MNKEQYTERVIEMSNALLNLRRDVELLARKCNMARVESPEMIHEWQLRKTLLDAMGATLEAASFHMSELWF